ncbi:MAG: beta-ketoacyl-[acyl-carrier-protein] synthase family protein [Bradymonadia bacterium]
MKQDKVVITGSGCVTPLGGSVDETWASLMEGKNAIGPIEKFDARTYPTTFAAEIKGFKSPSLPHRLERWADLKTRYALSAVKEALAQSNLNAAQLRSERIGVSIGSEVSRPPLQEIAERFALIEAGETTKAFRMTRPSEFVSRSSFFPATAIAQYVGCRGPLLTTSTACTSSAQSIGDALRVIRRGEADVMIAGGTDSLIEELMVMGFSLLGALSTRNDDPETACRPFDRTRDGFVLGEGAGFIVLESEAHARERGAKILGELRGFGASANAWRVTDSPPDGRGACSSMRAAIEDAGVSSDSISYINAHGTSTQQNDQSETAAIKALFGEHASKLAISSTKSMMGHLVAACGAVELIVCLKACMENRVPPTINYQTSDPMCDLDFVPNQSRAITVDMAMSNAFGFGGSNGSLLVSKYQR